MKDKRFTLRLNDNELTMLEQLARLYNKPKSDYIRYVIDLAYKVAKNQGRIAP